MRAHVIENEKIINTVVVESLNDMPGLIDADQGGQIGDSWDGAIFSTPSKYKTIEDAIIAKHTAINAIRDEKLAAGFPYVFTDTAGTIQTRDLRDYINILGNVVAGMLLNGQAVVMPFRDAEDSNHSLTPSETITMGLSALNSYTEIYKTAWAHKDALKVLAEGGATIQQIIDYDITTGW